MGRVRVEVMEDGYKYRVDFDSHTKNRRLEFHADIAGAFREVLFC